MTNQKTENKKSLIIVQLYPKEMNIYGDTGNTLVLRRRAEWRGIDVTVKLVNVGDTVPADADIILGGGGQDAGQGVIEQDLQKKSDDLRRLAERGVVMLMICGMYQLFGRSFTTKEGRVIKGIGIFPLETIGGDERHIGNTLYQSKYGELVGYENHSGITKLDNLADAIGQTKLGAGNNGEDSSEGCRVQNVFGTYSHGPVLPKNPMFADLLLSLALRRKYGNDYELEHLDDNLENRAHITAKSRPR